MEKKIFEIISPIIDDYWEDFQDKKSKEDVKKFIVQPSIPIIWFGDLEKYLNSNLKVITVSINPSDKEFKNNSNNSSFWRFKGIDEAFVKKTTLDENDKQVLAKAYNSYFTENPYTSYFDYFSAPLDYFNCSYYGEKTNTAIHVDLYTPIATNLWKTLTNEQKQAISKTKENENLFSDFLDRYLQPDIILFSTRKSELKKIFKVNLKNDIIWKPAEKAKGFNMELYKRTYRINEKEFAQFILYGRNNYGKPFNLGNDFIKQEKEFFVNKIKDCSGLNI